MQVKSHGATGSGIKVRKSAGKTDSIETLDGYRQALKKEGSFARIRRDWGDSLADLANEMLAFFTDRAKGLNSDLLLLLLLSLLLLEKFLMWL